MNILEVFPMEKKVYIEMNLDELYFIRQAMNEVCNGIDIGEWEFETRLGYKRTDGDPIMDQLSTAFRALQP